MKDWKQFNENNTGWPKKDNGKEILSKCLNHTYDGEFIVDLNIQGNNFYVEIRKCINEYFFDGDWFVDWYYDKFNKDLLKDWAETELKFDIGEYNDETNMKDYHKLARLTLKALDNLDTFISSDELGLL